MNSRRSIEEKHRQGHEKYRKALLSNEGEVAPICGRPNFPSAVTRISPMHARQKGMYNAKSETVDKKPSYRSAFKSRRCLLPAAKFDEKGHYFSLPDDQPFAFAGLWESWHDGEIVSCTFLTTEPNEEIRAVGHPRMPVILSSEAEYARWLDPEITTRAPLEGLMKPLEDGSLVCVPKG